MSRTPGGEDDSRRELGYEAEKGREREATGADKKKRKPETRIQVDGWG